MTEHKTGCQTYRIIGYTNPKDRADYCSSDYPIYGKCTCGLEQNKLETANKRIKELEEEVTFLKRFIQGVI